MNCLQIITHAMRRLGLLAAGTLPDETAVEDHLETLKSLYKRFVNEGTLGRLDDVIAPTDVEFVASPQTRIVAFEPVTIRLPQTVSDCEGEETTPRDGSVIVIVHRTTRQTTTFIYDASEHAWFSIDGLRPTDAAPLSYRDPVGFACILATELADEYGQELKDVTVRNALSFRASLTHNFSSPDAPIPGVFF